MRGTLAILGAAGAIGRVVSRELVRRKMPHRVIGRDRSKLETLFGGTAEIVPADLSSPDDAAAALAGAESVVYSVGLPYPQFELHPVLMKNAVDAAARAGVSRMAVISSVYSYGAPQTPKVAEAHPREPATRKGRLRKQQEDIAIGADGNGSLRTLVLHLPDFYGPDAEVSLADLIFKGAITGKAATWLGSPDLPHEFVYVPDAAPVILDLMDREDSLGQRWNFGGPGTITGREFAQLAYAATGHTPKLRPIGKAALRFGGLFSTLLRELVELNYLATTPVVLDDAKLAKHLGSLRKTSYADGIVETVRQYQERLAVRA